jgi:hypothetical protein
MKCRIRQIPLTACLTFRPYLSAIWAGRGHNRRLVIDGAFSRSLMLEEADDVRSKLPFTGDIH